MLNPAMCGCWDMLSGLFWSAFACTAIIGVSTWCASCHLLLARPMSLLLQAHFSDVCWTVRTGTTTLIACRERGSKSGGNADHNCEARLCSSKGRVRCRRCLQFTLIRGFGKGKQRYQRVLTVQCES